MRVQFLCGSRYDVGKSPNVLNRVAAVSSSNFFASCGVQMLRLLTACCSVSMLARAFDSFTVQVGGTFDSNCGKAYVASAAAACSYISKMNAGKGLAIGPNKDYFLKFNFSFDFYPVNGYFTNDQGYKLARARFQRSHLIIGEGSGCNHAYGLNT